MSVEQCEGGEKPNHFAVRQYKKYKLAAGKTAKSILISCGARLAVFDIAELREVTAYDDLELDTRKNCTNGPVKHTATRVPAPTVPPKRYPNATKNTSHPIRT